MFKNIDAIIFDWDNTLFEFKQYWKEAHEIAFYQNKYDRYGITFDDFLEVYHSIDNELWHLVLNKEITLDELRINRLILTFKEFHINIESEDATSFFNSFIGILLKNIVPNYNLIQNVKVLSNYFDLSILTNGKTDEQKKKISRAGFDGIIPYYISEDIGIEKPDIEAFEYVLSERKLMASTTLMVGDSYSNDILPAKKLGLKTVYIGDEKNIDADYSFRTVDAFIAEVMKNI